MADYTGPPPFGYATGQQDAAPSYNNTTSPSLQSYGAERQDQAQMDNYNQKQSVYNEIHSMYNRAQSIAAFIHNKGYPGFSPAEVASGIPPLPIYQNWDPNSYATSTNTSSNRDELYAPGISNPNSSFQVTQHAQQVPSQTSLPRAAPRADPAVEEGELSEGEYEDNAASKVPKRLGPSSQHGNKRRYDEYEPESPRPSQHQRTHPTQRLQGETIVSEGQTDMYGRSLDLSRQRSDSYSPHISPVQPISAPIPSASLQPPKLVHPSTIPYSLDSIEQSLREARKDAQNAILNLWPFKVRLEHYFEEGIDEEIVRQQFKAIRMLPPANDLKATEANEGEMPTPVELEPSPHPTPSLAKNVSSKEDKGEERKDRIARLLAEKTKKATNTIVQPGSTTSAVVPEATTASNSAKADKERLLRQKMEALQKSREARALKVSAKTTQPVPAITNPKPQVPTSTQSIDSSKDLALLPKAAEQQVTDTSRQSISSSASPSHSQLSKQMPPSIPGLFLARSASNTPSIPTSSGSITANVVNQRNRPVASDFDAPASMEGPYKRPFGQSRNDHPLVIDVSEDESDDDSYHEPEVHHQTGNTVLRTNENGLLKTSTMRDQPPLSDVLPQKIPAHYRGATSSTPSTPQPQGKTTGKPEDLQRKELEIQELRRKIALVEQRKKAKRDLTGSQLSTAKQVTTGENTPAQVSSISDKIEASVQIEQLLQDANRQIYQNQHNLAEAQAVVAEQSVELNVTEVEQRRLRRARIVADLPMLDAEVEASQKKLLELKAEMAKLEAAVERGLENKRKLAEEMEKLGHDADEQLREQKTKLETLVRAETENVNANVQHPEAQPLPSGSSPVVSGTESDEMAISPTVNQVDLKMSAPDTQDQAVSDVAPVLAAPAEVHNDIVESASEVLTNTGTLKPDSKAIEVANTQSLDAALQNAIADAEAESMAPVSGDVEMEDAYAPVLEDNASSSVTSSGRDEPDDIVVGGTSADVSDDDGESDQYEPPEATPAPSDDAPMSMDSPPFSPAPPENIGAKATDPEHSIVAVHPKEAPTRRFSHNNYVRGDAKPTQHVIGVNPSETTTSFSPYESPLKRFRAFRFHPSFLDEISGGFKSLTYSNNIKQDQELCRFELAGGICNDKTCEFQHFKSLSLADDAILVELGNSAGYSEADKPRFISGLRNVLNRLRAKKTKDFKVIAAEIAAYRTRFLDDKSKVLLLEDTSI